MTKNPIYSTTWDSATTHELQWLSENGSYKQKEISRKLLLESAQYHDAHGNTMIADSIRAILKRNGPNAQSSHHERKNL